MAPRRRADGEKMQVEDNSVEAFETVHGVPVLGVQWHPEAYEAEPEDASIDRKPECHRNLLLHMSKAGDAYRAKRITLQELQSNKIFENKKVLSESAALTTVGRWKKNPNSSLTHG